MKSGRVVIQDASILIDLVNGGILGAWFRLDITTVATDFVLDEVRAGPQWTQIAPMVDAGMLEVASVPEAEATKWYGEMSEIYRAHGISMADASTYVYAKAHRIPLLTGDGKLRAISLQADLDVRGILWVLDELVSVSFLSGADATDALEAILAAGAWLPHGECERRFNLWAKDGKR